ncbi:hypothetical protein ACQP1G_14475 [Nocardia sp. CA-107356]|uniref:hypothetical protein n=1 Tax=Nocardia sp. CA-107356 TaxID=3239972 RepID=UPI003D8D161B
MSRSAEYVGAASSTRWCCELGRCSAEAMAELADRSRELRAKIQRMREWRDEQ